MNRALELAVRGKGWVSPNPCVGCVIVKGNRIIGEGYHQKFGGPHAEILALRNAGPKARGATMYLTLEPCTHWGKTPPCAPEIRNAGIKKVYLGLPDPNPQVKGQGIKLLRRAGVKVEVGIEKEACESIMKSYLTWREKKRPYVILKMAMTLDGKIASTEGDSKWISSQPSRRLVHQLRAESDAVLVGHNTIVQDNPSLTSHGKGRNPLRIILDPGLRSPLKARVFNDGKASTVIFAAVKMGKKASLFRKKGVKIRPAKVKMGLFNLMAILKELSKINVSQLFIEGGGETSWSFLKARLVDELWIFMAPKILGGRDAKTAVEGPGFDQVKQALKLNILSLTPCGTDLLIRAALAE